MNVEIQPRTDRFFGTGSGGSWRFLPRREIIRRIEAADLERLDAWAASVSDGYEEAEAGAFALAVLVEAWDRAARMRVAQREDEEIASQCEGLRRGRAESARRARGAGFKSPLAAKHFARRDARHRVEREAYARSGDPERQISAFWRSISRASDAGSASASC